MDDTSWELLRRLLRMKRAENILYFVSEWIQEASFKSRRRHKAGNRGEQSSKLSQGTDVPQQNNAAWGRKKPLTSETNT